MAGFYVRRSGFTHVGELMLSVVADLTANGFNMVFPIPWIPPIDVAGRAKFSVTLEAGPTVDKLNEVALPNKQPWRVQIQVFDKHTAGIVVGSQQAIRTDGSLSHSISGGKLQGPLGCIGGYYTVGTTPALLAPNPASSSEGFISRTGRVMLGAIDLSESSPMTYHLSITDHGIMLCVWEDFLSDSGAAAISWMLVQRPVDRVSGVPVITGKAPVFCMYSTGLGIKRFTVRESDVLRPSEPIDATADTDYNNAIINSLEQVAISEGNKYVVSFPSRLNTTRYAYTYELDMLGYTGADVVSENTDVPLTVYGEATPRKYVSLLANGANNTGMRIIAIKEGGGISAP